MPNQAVRSRWQYGEVRKVYLHPGQVFVSDEPTSVVTILGSCVAVGLWDQTTGIGGVSHFLLPYRTGAEGISTEIGGVALATLFDRVQRLGAHQPGLLAKVFGGARILSRESRDPSLGERNVQLAHDFLRDLDIVVAAHDVGGSWGRKVIFQTHDGMDKVRPL